MQQTGEIQKKNHSAAKTNTTEFDDQGSLIESFYF